MMDMTTPTGKQLVLYTGATFNPDAVITIKNSGSTVNLTGTTWAFRITTEKKPYESIVASTQCTILTAGSGTLTVPFSNMTLTAGVTKIGNARFMLYKVLSGGVAQIQGSAKRLKIEDGFTSV